jgi:hypothetical protein
VFARFGFSQGAGFLIQPEGSFAFLLVGPMTVEAPITQQRPYFSGKVDFRSAGQNGSDWGGLGGDRLAAACDQNYCREQRRRRKNDAGVLKHDNFHLPDAAEDAWREAEATESIIADDPGHRPKRQPSS